MDNTATLTSTFEIAIPKAVREARQWEAGQKFVCIPEEDGVLFLPVPKLDELFGIAKGLPCSDYRDRNDRY